MKNLRKSLWIILIVSILLRVLSLGMDSFGIVLEYTLLAFCAVMDKAFALAGSMISFQLVRKNKPSCISDKILCVLYIANVASWVFPLSL